MPVSLLRSKSSITTCDNFALSGVEKTGDAVNNNIEEFSTTLSANLNELVLREKPHSDIYEYALNYLKVDEKDCLAIEDTEESLKSAMGANIKCVAFPGKYHTQDKFRGSFALVDKLSTDLFN